MLSKCGCRWCGLYLLSLWVYGGSGCSGWVDVLDGWMLWMSECSG